MFYSTTSIFIAKTGKSGLTWFLPRKYLTKQVQMIVISVNNYQTYFVLTQKISLKKSFIQNIEKWFLIKRKPVRLLH